MLGTYALSAGYYDAYYLKALKVRRLIRQDYDQAFAKVDLIAGPVTTSTAFRIGEKVNDPLSMYLIDLYTVSANLAGVGGIAFPAALAPAGCRSACNCKRRRSRKTGCSALPTCSNRRPIGTSGGPR